jgi:glyoxalase family protein
VTSDEAQRYWQERIRDHGVQVTPVLDRKYFRSIYFQDPDGHILEIATTEPGFLVDQPVDRLGHDLALPDWLEPERETIEAGLRPIHLGEGAAVS